MVHETRLPLLEQHDNSDSDKYFERDSNDGSAFPLTSRRLRLRPRAFIPRWLLPYPLRWVLLIPSLITCLISLTYVAITRSEGYDYIRSTKSAPAVPRLGHPCQLVSQGALDRLRSQSEEPSIVLYHQGEPVAEHNTTFTLHTELCILVAVPQRLQPIYNYTEAVVPDTGPDSIFMHMNSSTIEIDFQPPLPLPGQGDLLLFNNGTLVYYQEVALHHAGIYDVHATIETSSWLWAKQWQDDVEHHYTHYMTGLNVPFDSEESRKHDLETPYREPHVTITSKAPSKVMVVAGPQATRPLCDDRLTASTHGRWHSSGAFDVPGGLVDEWGMAWDGDYCRMQYYNEQDTLDCLANRTIYIHGDSNARRIGKSLISGGRFCRRPNHDCQDRDAWTPTLRLGEDPRTGQLVELVGDLQKDYAGWTYPVNAPYPRALVQDFGYNSTMAFSFQRRIVGDWLDWAGKLYDRFDWSADSQKYESPPGNVLPKFRWGTDIREGAKARKPPEIGSQPDFVLIGIGSWDEQFSELFDDFERVLPYFRDAIFEAFPNATIMLRLTHGISPQWVNWGWRRSSGMRFRHFNDIMRRVFEVNEAERHGMGGRVLVLNSEPFGGTKDVDIDYPNRMSVHLRFSRVRTEAQILLNSVCKKNPKTGKASWRWS